jgi:ABC-type glycerol-3-phosphate transport system substrate-binding protein
MIERLALRLTLWLAGLTLFFGAGCNLVERLQIGSPGMDPTPATTTPTPDEPSPAPDMAATPTPQATAVSQRTLIVWLPPEIGGRTQTAMAVLTEQIHAFNTGHPDLQIIVQQKNVGGPGGMLSYLRTGRGVAPSILPDLMVLPGDRLHSAFTEELIYPLGASVSSEMMEVLYPAAQSVARPQGVTLGYPFALTNLPHLAYDTAVITGTFPVSFTQMLDLPDSTLLYPGSGTDGIMIWLQLYQAYEGQLVNEAGQPTLQAEPLRLALANLGQARQQGFITSQSSNVGNLAEAWQLFAGGGATIVQTSAGQFLRERVPEQTYGVASVPGLNEPLTPLVDSWVWTISTPDPVQRDLAVELIVFLTQPENLSAWSQAAHILPARADALTQWDLDDPYIQFLDQELERAQPNPITPSSQLMNVLRDAVFDVTSLAETPRAAAENAAAIFE